MPLNLNMGSKPDGVSISAWSGSDFGQSGIRLGSREMSLESFLTMAWCVLKPSGCVVDGTNTDARRSLAKNLKSLQPIEGRNAHNDASAKRLGHVRGVWNYYFRMDTPIVVKFDDCSITEADFVYALEYVLTSTDLEPGDPRPAFVKILASEMAAAYQPDD